MSSWRAGAATRVHSPEFDEDFSALPQSCRGILICVTPKLSPQRFPMKKDDPLLATCGPPRCSNRRKEILIIPRRHKSLSQSRQRHWSAAFPRRFRATQPTPEKLTAPIHHGATYPAPASWTAGAIAPLLEGFGQKPDSQTLQRMPRHRKTRPPANTTATASNNSVGADVTRL